MKSLRERIIAKLIEYNLITSKKLKEIVAKHSKDSISLGKILIKEGIISEQDYMIFLSQELQVPPIDLSKYKIEPHLKELLAEKFCKRSSSPLK